ncbi:MAG: DUF1080 domain-containing protein [Ginsengibacter sp.]
MTYILISFKRTTFLIVFIIILFAGCKLADKKSSDEEKPEISETTNGWIQLFNGTTNAGWHTYGKDSVGNAWNIEDSSLHLDASSKNDWQTKDGGDIVTNDEYENFDLQLDWKISEGGNSGIMFYVKEDTLKYKHTWHTGPEMQVADNEKNEDGKIYKSQAGDIYELFPTNSEQCVNPAGKWNHVEIISDKGKLDLYMNDNHTLDTTIWNNAWEKNIAGTKFKDMPYFGTFKKGKIALQDHGADVWYKNIRIKNL